MKPVIIISITLVLLIPINVYAQLDDTPKPLEPQPKMIEVIKNPSLSVNKIEIEGWIIGEISIDEKNNRLLLQAVKTPHPGYDKGLPAIAIISAEIHPDNFSNFKIIEFESPVFFDVNSEINKIYLFESNKQEILIMDSISLEILDKIKVSFESNYRQRDIAVNENTNKIYQLLEELGTGGTVHNKEYKIQVYDSTTKNLIKEIELHEPASELLIDHTKNLT